LPVWLGVPESADNERNGRDVFGVPALFLLSQNDRKVRPAHQASIAEAYAGPKCVVWSTSSHDDPIDVENAPRLPDGVRWLLQQASR